MTIVRNLLNSAATAIAAAQAVAEAKAAVDDAVDQATYLKEQAKANMTNRMAKLRGLWNGPDPIWLNPSFREEVLGASLSKDDAAPTTREVLDSMALVTSQLKSLASQPSAVQAAAAAVHESFSTSLAACQAMAPVAQGPEPQPTQAVLAAVVARVRALGAGQALALPGGVSGGAATVYVLHCVSSGVYTFAVCAATGEGLAFHVRRRVVEALSIPRPTAASNRPRCSAPAQTLGSRACLRLMFSCANTADARRGGHGGDRAQLADGPARRPRAKRARRVVLVRAAALRAQPRVQGHRRCGGSVTSRPFSFDRATQQSHMPRRGREALVSGGGPDSDESPPSRLVRSFVFHHHAGALYHQLLPYLNKRPLRANLPAEGGAGAHWLSPTADGGDGDRCGHRAASLAAIVALQLHVCRLGAPPLQPASRHTAQPNLLLRRARPMLRQMGASGSGSNAGAGAGGVAAMTEAQRLAAAGWHRIVKMPSWWRHVWPPSARVAASEGLELPSALVRRGPTRQPFAAMDHAGGRRCTTRPTASPTTTTRPPAPPSGRSQSCRRCRVAVEEEVTALSNAPRVRA